MSNVQIDGGFVIKKYQERLSEAMHTVILLEARVAALETQLLEAMTATPTPEKNGGPVSTPRAKKAAEDLSSPDESQP